MVTITMEIIHDMMSYTGNILFQELNVVCLICIDVYMD